MGKKKLHLVSHFSRAEIALLAFLLQRTAFEMTYLSLEQVIALK
jgi:hypothetical protein